MCGRYTLKTSARELAGFAESLGLPAPPPMPPRYNIAPTQRALAVRASVAGGREWAWLKWGLVPAWADDPALGARMINARSETVADKPAFRQAFRSRRCLVVADGFYEWRAEGGRKVPHHIRLRGGAPFAFAGLWERWTKGAEPVESCTVLTTTPNELMAPLHDRMPVILTPDDFATWLDPSVRDAAVLTPLLRPFAASAMEAFPVSPRVGNPAHDDPACVEPQA